MRNYLFYAGAVIAGGLLALVHMTGLWWTVKRASAVDHPVHTMLLSFLGRTALTVSVLVGLTAHDWRYLPLSFLGFLLVRTLMIWRIGS